MFLKLIFKLQEHLLIGLRKEGSAPVQEHILIPENQQKEHDLEGKGLRLFF